MYFLLSRIIRIVDTVGLKLIVEEELETLLSSDLALSVMQTDGTNFQEMFFSISDPDNVQVLKCSCADRRAFFRGKMC